MHLLIKYFGDQLKSVLNYAEILRKSAGLTVASFRHTFVCSAQMIRFRSVTQIKEGFDLFKSDNSLIKHCNCNQITIQFICYTRAAYI